MIDPSQPLLRIGRTDVHVRGGFSAGDITRSGADVLVSSAGTGATMSSGVSKDIRAAGGESILAALRAHQPLVPGDVVITSAGDLPAKNIYHAVVVGWRDERKVLQATVWRVVNRCMGLAQLSSIASIAFPSLGTGSGKADPFETHSTMAAACLQAIGADTSLRQILFCFKYHNTAETFRRAFLQQQLIRQTRGLSVADSSERDQLTRDLTRLWPSVLDLNASLDKLAALVARLEQDPSASVINYFVNTGGGAFVGGDVNTGGGDFVGRDKR